MDLYGARDAVVLLNDLQSRHLTRKVRLPPMGLYMRTPRCGPHYGS